MTEPQATSEQLSEKQCQTATGVTGARGPGPCSAGAPGIPSPVGEGLVRGCAVGPPGERLFRVAMNDSNYNCIQQTIDEANNEYRQQLLFKSLTNMNFPVLGDGFIRLVDKMGSDAAIVQAARTSYGTGTKTISDDTALIRILQRHMHTSPFEMAELKFHIRVPMDTWRQWVRHRMASINEYSTRYSEAIDSQDVTPPNCWRLQDQNNKQGSNGYLEQWPEDPAFFERALFRGLEPCIHPGGYLSEQERKLHEHAWEVYQQRLALGVAREQARKDLPLSTYTEAYWKIDLHNLFHFLALRMDKHAQSEIRLCAKTIGYEIVSKLFPICWQAFLDYRFHAMRLSTLDQKAVTNLLQLLSPDESVLAAAVAHITNKRERAEALVKLQQLTAGVIPNSD